MSFNKKLINFQELSLTEKVFFFYTIILSFTIILQFVFIPFSYNSLHIEDTFLLAESAWRVFNGGIPGVDFEHYFGGISSSLIAQSFKIWGVSIKSIDYAFLIQYLIVIVMLYIATYKRVSLISGITVFFVLTGVMLTRIPYEEYSSLIVIESAHSFSYNRFGMALMFVMMIFALFTTHTKKIDYFVAVIMGGAAFLLIFTKTTFFIFFIGFILVLLIKKRGIELLLVSILLIALSLAYSMPVERLWNTFNYAKIANNVDGAYWWLLMKPLRIFWSQAWAFMIVISSIIYLYLNITKELISVLISVVIFFIVMMMVAMTMGAEGMTGHHVLPMLAVIMICLFEIDKRINNSESLIFKTLIAVMVIPIISLHIALSTLANLKGLHNKDAVYFSKGPLKGYLASGSRATFDTTKINMVDNAARYLEMGGVVNIDTHYAGLADAYNYFSQIESTNLRLGSDSPLGFSFSMMTEPVMDYLIWPREGALLEKQYDAIPIDIDVMLMSLYPGSNVSAILLPLVNQDFQLCNKTKLWNVYVRKDKELTMYCYY